MFAKIHLLLSTYNGAHFLSDQMDSIFSQSCPPSVISIRDDASTDGTYEKVCEYGTSRPNIRVIQGKRLGPAASFLELLRDAESECDYFAFADQDDVWMPAKLENAVSRLAQHGSCGPLMYCSRVEYVDIQLKHLGFSSVPGRVGFANALVENVAIGCTVLLNREARRVIVGRLPSNALMHDWWCYLVVSAFGTVIYDERPSVKYRLHGRNAVGAPASVREKFIGRMLRFLKYEKGTPRLTDQALEFQRCFGALLNQQELKKLERFLAVRGNLWSRIAYSAQMDVWRQSWIDDAILRTLILIGRV